MASIISGGITFFSHPPKEELFSSLHATALSATAVRATSAAIGELSYESQADPAVDPNIVLDPNPGN